MTTETRLDRLETLAETTLLAIQQLALQQRDLASQQRDLASQQRDTQQNLTASVQDLVSMITQLATDAAEDRKLITGLQTENRRILERLEGHIQDGHHHSAS